MYKILIAVLLLGSSCAKAADWNEAYNGRSHQVILEQVQPSKKYIATWALIQMDLLPAPARKAFVLKHNADGSSTTLHYNLNRNKVAIGLKITF